MRGALAGLAFTLPLPLILLLEALAMTEHFTGHNKAQLEASPNRFFLACAILALSIAFLMSAALAGTTVFRKEWQFASDARV